MNIKNIHPIETNSRTKPSGETLFNNPIFGLTPRPPLPLGMTGTGH
jgi:hypothetical protein